MSGATPSVVELLLKIKRMADGGQGGEAQAARNKLTLLLRKHKLCLDDLAKNEREARSFKAANRREVRLLGQIVYAVTGQPAAEYWRAAVDPLTYYLKLTPLEYVEVAAQWAYYQPRMRAELRRQQRRLREHFLEAYVMANAIFPAETPAQKEPTSKKLEQRLHEAWKIAQAITSAPYQPARRLLTEGARHD